MFAVKITRYRNHAMGHFHPPGVSEIGVTGLPQEHPERSNDEEDTEDVEHPMKGRYQCKAESDHDATHNQRSENAPDQNSMLRLSRHPEMIEDQDKHKNVVHAQGV